MDTRIYPGIDKDRYGGMTDIGRIIRDAWVFGLIPETETGIGWTYSRVRGALRSGACAVDETRPPGQLPAAGIEGTPRTDLC